MHSSTLAPPVAIQVVAQLSSVDNELARIRLWLFLVALGGIALASGAGFLVARATLRPVRELSETAERVRATRDLSQRIAVEGTDELAHARLDLQRDARVARRGRSSASGSSSRTPRTSCGRR